MALFKIFKGLKDNLPKTYNDGYCYVTIDDGKMYIDTTNTENGRIVLNASHADTATMANRLDCDKVGTHEIPIYFDGGIPTACNYNFKDFLPLSAGENKKLTGALGLTENIMYGPKAPESGFEGQLFFIEDNSDPLPKGGKTNQVLVKNSKTDGDASWQDKAPAAIAADKLTSNAGSSTLPVYFSGGVPVATGDSLDVNITKNAATATKLATTRALAITDADGTNKGTGFNFDGSTGGTFKLPATIKANITGSISGNAASADKLNNDAGDSSTPVYFSGGVPVACTSLDLNTSGNAATATKLKTARTISISDNDGTNTATGTSFNGSADITVKLPTTIKANLTGNADTATTADKLSVNGGNAETPIYFDAGVPSSCTSVKLPKIQGTNAVVAGESTGSFIAIQPEEIMVNKVAEGATTGEQFSLTSAKLKKLNTLSTASVGSTSSPVYFNGGTVTECGDSLDVDITGNAASADKLTVNGGDPNTPVYFTAGVPTPCTGLDLDTSGNAATATQWKNARNFYISDSDGTNTGVATSVNGTDNATIKLPETIKATLSGKATSAGTADKLGSNGGNSTVPVYFDAGVPTPCTSLSLDTTGNAATATNVAWSGVTSKPSYYDAKAIKSISRSGTTFTATHLDGTTSTFDQQDNNSDTKVTQTVTTTNANYPLLLAPSGQTATTTATSYFDSGVTLNPNTNTIAANISGNAATATKLATARTITTNLASTSAASFDGSANITPGVTGILGYEHGGTNANSRVNAWRKLMERGTNNTDFNTVKDCGIYWCQLKDCTNTPLGNNKDGNFGYLEVWNAFDSSVDNMYQRFTLYDNGRSWFRSFVNSAWSNWYVQDPSQFLPLSGGTMTGALTTQSSLRILPQDSAHEGGEIILYPATSSFKTGYIDLYDNKIRYHDGTSEHFTVDLSTGEARAQKIYGAVWNDYAEFRTQKETIEPGYCVASADNGQVYKTTEKFQACDGIVSDTFGFAIGETDECKTPLAVAGRVLAYCEGDRNDYHSGDTVCAGPDGKVVKMTREEIREWPDRIIGIVSEIPEYETWGTGNVAVDGRIWIKVK